MRKIPSCKQHAWRDYAPPSPTSLTARDDIKLGVQAPYARMFGDTPDISNLAWGWYYRDNKSFPRPREVLGRVLGPANNLGNEMARSVQQINGKVVVRRTLRRLRPDELAASNEVESRRRSLFDNAIQQLLGTSYSSHPILPENPLQAKVEDVLNDEHQMSSHTQLQEKKAPPTHHSLRLSTHKGSHSMTENTLPMRSSESK